MIELKLKNRKGSFHVNSKEVKDIIAARQDIGYLQDISNSINQDNKWYLTASYQRWYFLRKRYLKILKH